MSPEQAWATCLEDSTLFHRTALIEPNGKLTNYMHDK